MLEKVTAFITRPTDTGWAVLLIRHPYAGLQFPAGTVELGEAPLDAAIREAYEETGLAGLTVQAVLGFSEQYLTDETRLVIAPAPIYARPDPTSFHWANLPRGLRVSRLREADGFVQVQYIEPDRWPDPTYTSMEITGWTPAQALTHHLRRHFVWFEASPDTPTEWMHFSDNHAFTLIWADPSQLATLNPPFDEWAAKLLAALRH